MYLKTEYNQSSPWQKKDSSFLILFLLGLLVCGLSVDPGFSGLLGGLGLQLGPHLG